MTGSVPRNAYKMNKTSILDKINFFVKLSDIVI